MSFLVRSSVDKDLDDLFSGSNHKPAEPTHPISTVSVNQTEKSKKRPHSSRTSEISLEPKKRKRSKTSESDSTKPFIVSPRESISQSSSPSKKESVPDDDGGSGNESSPPPAHESTKIIVPSKRSTKHPKKEEKVNHAPPDETSSQRDARTVFIGNVDLRAFTETNEKKGLKAIRRLVLDSLEEYHQSKEEKPFIESLRIRSVPFATPTKDGQGKKRAWLKGDVHPQGKVCNVFVVFGFGSRQVMDPYRAAELAASSLNGTMYLGRRLRVDSTHAPHDGSIPFTVSKALFLGSLDFDVDEEAVRTLLEQLSFEALDEDEDGEPVTKHVLNIRIIRDRDTQVGKGIGYVELDSTHSLDAILALYQASPSKFKIEGRKLRIERCKAKHKATISASGISKRPPKMSPVSQSDVQEKAAQLATLSKEERKRVKKMDRERIERRLRKKTLKTRNTKQERLRGLGR